MNLPSAGYSGKSQRYFSGVRQDFLDLLPDSDAASILEIGCGFGDTGSAALSQGKCRYYAGVELVPEAAEKAKESLTEVLEGNVEELVMPWPEGTFDALLMSEVLEHLVEPWTTLERVVRLLRPGALVLASSPNVAHVRIITSLLRGRWELTDSGPMDRTHLRWFTPVSYREMFEKCGVQVVEVGPMAPSGWRGRLLNALSGDGLRHLTMRQIRLVGYRR